MSQRGGPKKVLSRQIDEETAADHDLLVTWASSIPPDRLPTLEEWLKADGPTGSYTGPKPTYQLKFDWRLAVGAGYTNILENAMETCFGRKGESGWEVWIRGDQLNLLVGDFRKEYLRLLGFPPFGSDLRGLDAWIQALLSEFKRM